MKVLSTVKEFGINVGNKTKDVTGIVVHKTGDVAKTVTNPVKVVVVKRYAIHRAKVEINDRLALAGLGLLAQDKQVTDVVNEAKAQVKAEAKATKAAQKAAGKEMVTAS